MSVNISCCTKNSPWCQNSKPTLWKATFLL